MAAARHGLITQLHGKQKQPAGAHRIRRSHGVCSGLCVKHQAPLLRLESRRLSAK